MPLLQLLAKKIIRFNLQCPWMHEPCYCCSGISKWPISPFGCCSVLRLLTDRRCCCRVCFCAAKLSFRWILNEFPTFIPLDKRRFVSQITGNLYISKADSSDRGNYSCIASSPSISKSVFSNYIPLEPLAERLYFTSYYCLCICLLLTVIVALKHWFKFAACAFMTYIEVPSRNLS